MHILTRWPQSPRVVWNEDRTGGYLPDIGHFKLAPGVVEEAASPPEEEFPPVDMTKANRLPRPIPRFITYQQLVADTLSLVAKLPHIVEVVGVARSGILPASVLATVLHVPLRVLDQERGVILTAGSGWRMRDYRKRKGTTLIVDDTTGSGRALRMTKHALSRCCNGELLKDSLTVSIYCNPYSEYKPDLHAVDLYLPHLLEWNFANSIVSSTSAFDMDGIICHDELSGGVPGTPLYLPRREPAHIITGRSEKHRKGTEDWLRHHGVEIASLTMAAFDHPSSFYATIAEYKAKHVIHFASTAGDRPFGEPIFWESCPHQARKIAELSGVLTVCPRTGDVFDAVHTS